MVPKRGYQFQKFKVSLDVALSILGESSKPILLHYIMKRYGVSYRKARECTVMEIEMVLRNILGPGAAIIIERMHSELAKLENK
ncbi:MAG TPA: hypothetical protein VJ742_07750 [Nitrososphaera sp.]|jgi:hypothetical protein|nr:hypothetical protein [Nitrososphaera sp.]